MTGKPENFRIGIESCSGIETPNAVGLPEAGLWTVGRPADLCCCTTGAVRNLDIKLEQSQIVGILAPQRAHQEFKLGKPT